MPRSLSGTGMSPLRASPPQGITATTCRINGRFFLETRKINIGIAEHFLKPRRGFVVAPLSVADIRDLFTAQALLAGELVARATTRMGAADLRGLNDVQEALRKAAQAGDGERVESLNHGFHRRINLAADAPRLAWMLSISTRFAPRRFFATIPGWSEISAQDHAAIIKAVTERDADAARAAMMRHMENAGDLLAANFESAQATAQPRYSLPGVGASLLRAKRGDPG